MTSSITCASKTRSSSKLAFADLALGAVKTGRWRHIDIRWLSKGDIIEYVRVEDLADGVGGWADNAAAYDRRRDRSQGIKDWIEDEYGVRVTTSDVRRATAALDSQDHDVTRLLDEINRIAGA